MPDDLQKRGLAAESEAIVVTEAFAVGWPNTPHRVLRSALQAAEAFQGEVVGATLIRSPSRCRGCQPPA